MTTQDWVIIGAAWVALAAVQAGAIWDRHCDSRRADRHRDDLNNHARRLLHVEAAQRGLPTTTHAPMPIVTKVTATISGDRSLQPHSTYDRQRCAQDADQTLRLARPPALTDVAAAITHAGRPLTRAAITEQLGRDARTEIREQLLAGTLNMVRTHDSEPAYWPAGHGDTERMGRMSVLWGATS